MVSHSTQKYWMERFKKVLCFSFLWKCIFKMLKCPVNVTWERLGVTPSTILWTMCTNAIHSKMPSEDTASKSSWDPSLTSHITNIEKMVSNPHGGLMPKTKARTLWIRDKTYVILSSRAHRDIPRDPGHLASEIALASKEHQKPLLSVRRAVSFPENWNDKKYPSQMSTEQISEKRMRQVNHLYCHC